MFVRRIALLTIILAILLAVSSQPAQAQLGFQPVSQDELKMTSEPAAPGAPAVILYRQVDRDDNANTPHEDNYFRIKILTEEGRRNADVEIPFFKESSDVVHIKARTIRPDGSAAEFDGKVYEKWIVKARGTKLLVKTFTLPDVQVGSIIEYYYTVDLNSAFIWDSHWILSNELFTKRAKFTLREFHGSSSYYPIHLRWSWHALPPGTVGPTKSHSDSVQLEAVNIPAFETEDFMPPENEMKSRVDFIYSSDSFEKEADQFWKKVGRLRFGQLNDFINKQSAMQQAVATIVSPNDPPEVKLKKIYARVQKLRNTSFELSKTEQEEKRDKEKVAENVEDVWKKGNGNGVQLTWLYLALVRAAGFEAYGAWVSDRRNYFFDPKTMESGKLDANVVQVKLNGQDLYFDPGGKFAPYGLLEWTETGVQGLRLDKDGGTWIQTTLPKSSESRIERTANLKLTDGGDIEGKVKVTYTGLEAMYLRLQERNSDDTENKKSLEEVMQEQIPSASEVDLTNTPDWNNSEPPLVAEFDVKIPGWASNAGKKALLPVGFFTATEKKTFEHANRVHPIYFEFPFQKIDDVTLELPAGWQVVSLPQPQNNDGRIINYQLKVDKGGSSTVHITRNLNVDILILEQKYYTALRNFFQTIRTGDEQQIVLQPGTAIAGGE